MAKSQWSKFLIWMAGTAVVCLLAAFIFVIFDDPYGRLQIRKIHETTFAGERLSRVPRALEPAYDSAIIGNSVSVPLVPKRLSGLTGLNFVNLSISGTGADAHFYVARFFLDHHPDAKAMVFALDDSWCRSRGEWRPFPFWLYSSIPHYLLGLARETSVKLLSASRETRTERLPRDGFQTFNEAFVEKFSDKELVRKLLARERPTHQGAPDLAATIELAKFIKASTHVRVVVLWTPRYINLIPAPGSAAAQADRECKDSLKKNLSAVRNATIIDAAGDDRPENADPGNFYDFIHYSSPLASMIEREISAAIKVPMTQSNAL